MDGEKMSFFRQPSHEEEEQGKELRSETFDHAKVGERGDRKEATDDLQESVSD